MYQVIKEGRSQFTPPHTAQIPKDNGEFKNRHVNEAIDRVFIALPMTFLRLRNA